MNESKTSKQRYWLALMLDDLPIGEKFEPGRLHITIIPWFVTELEEADVIKSFYQNFSKSQKFEVTVGQNAFFGPKRNVGVSLIEPSKMLTELHQQALTWFNLISARWAVKRPHVADEYIAHIRRRRGTSLQASQVIKIDNLSLIAASRQEDNQRRVAARVELNG